MAKKEVNISIDDSALNDEVPTSTLEALRDAEAEPVHTATKKQKVVPSRDSGYINCLRNEKVIVRFVPKETDNITDKRHIAYGGMMDSAIKAFTVPLLSSGVFKNVLTKSEKAFLENLMGLEDNAMSIYNKVDNFWENFTVRLTKQDNILDLSDPNDYIKYKVLLANDNFIAPSMKALRDYPKATYQFVILEEGDEYANLKDTVNTKMKCYEEYGRVRDNFDILKTVIETIDGRTLSENTKLEFLQGKVGELIDADSRRFYMTITDPLLSTKILIRKAVSKRIILKRGDFYYLASDGTPLCNNGENPTLTVAASYINLPKNQELKFAIEAKIK